MHKRLTFDRIVEELGRFWERYTPASEFPVGTHVYTHSQPMPQTDAVQAPAVCDRIVCAREGACVDDDIAKARRCLHAPVQPMTDAARDACRALIAKVPHKPQAITYEKGWELLDELQRIAEIERIDRAKGE